MASSGLRAVIAALAAMASVARAQPAPSEPAPPAPDADAPAPPVAPAEAAAPTEPTPPGDPTPAPAPEVTPAAPVPVATPPATPAPPPPQVPRVRWPKARPFEVMAGFEVGFAWTADTDQLYGNGAGRALVLGLFNLEVRLLESYDLDDRSGGMFDAAGGHGRFGITSMGYRFMLDAGRFSARPLVGLAWVRRSSLRYDEGSTFGGFEHELMSQHGLGAMLGGGVGIRFGLLDLSVDARVYPTWWAEIGGDRAVVRDDAVVFEPITESPGGMPYTLTASLAIGY